MKSPDSQIAQATHASAFSNGKNQVISNAAVLNANRDIVIVNTAARSFLPQSSPPKSSFLHRIFTVIADYCAPPSNLEQTSGSELVPVSITPDDSEDDSVNSEYDGSSSNDHQDVSVNVSVIPCYNLKAFLSPGILLRAPSSCETYIEQMFPLKYGCPMWHPQPDRNLPVMYRRKGVCIGDVGIITPSGSFDFLFNIWLSAQHPINPTDLPDDFDSIPRPKLRTSFQTLFNPGGKVSSMDVESDMDVNTGDISYSCKSGERGAILSLPEGANQEDLKNESDLKGFIAQNVLSWYKYAQLNCGRELDRHSLYLVTGCIKSRAWGITTFDTEVEERQSFLVLGKSNTNYPSYIWKKSGGATSFRTGPSLDPGLTSENEDNENQCLFLRGFKMSLSEETWCSMQGRLDVPVSTKNGENPFLEKSYKSNSNNGTNDGNASSTHMNMGHGISISNFPAQNTPLFHPLNVVNDMLLTQVPEACIAFTHDNLWCEAIQGDYDIGKLQGMLQDHYVADYCKETRVCTVKARVDSQKDYSSVEENGLVNTSLPNPQSPIYDIVGETTTTTSGEVQELPKSFDHSSPQHLHNPCEPLAIINPTNGGEDEPILSSPLPVPRLEGRKIIATRVNKEQFQQHQSSQKSSTSSQSATSSGCSTVSASTDATSMIEDAKRDQKKLATSSSTLVVHGPVSPILIPPNPVCGQSLESVSAVAASPSLLHRASSSAGRSIGSRSRSTEADPRRRSLMRRQTIMDEGRQREPKRQKEPRNVRRLAKFYIKSDDSSESDGEDWSSEMVDNEVLATAACQQLPSQLPRPPDPERTQSAVGGKGYNNRKTLIRQQRTIAQARLAEINRDREMFTKRPSSSFTSLRNARSVGLLSQLMNPDSHIFPPKHPYRRGFSSREVGSGYQRQEERRQQQQQLEQRRLQQFEQRGQQQVRVGPLPRFVAPNLGKSKSAAALPALSGAVVGTAGRPVSPQITGVVAANCVSTGNNKYSPGPQPLWLEVEDHSGSEDEGREISRSTAEENLKALAERGKKKSASGIQDSRRRHSREAENYEIAEGPAHGRRALSEFFDRHQLLAQPQRPIPIPIPIGQPYNLPPPTAPMTLIKARQKMLQEELTESLRHQVLWHRQVNRTNIRGLKRTTSEGGSRLTGDLFAGLRPYTATPSMVQLSAKDSGGQKSGREERRNIGLDVSDEDERERVKFRGANLAPSLLMAAPDSVF